MFESIALICLGTAISIVVTLEFIRPLPENDPYYV
jgi:hypothetical protein